MYAENVLARRCSYPGSHRMEPYRPHFPDAGMLLPNTGDLAERVLCFPTASGGGEQEIQTVCELIGFFVERRDEIRGRAARLATLGPPQRGETGVVR